MTTAPSKLRSNGGPMILRSFVNFSLSGFLIIAALAPLICPGAKAEEAPVLNAMRKELDRSMSKLKNAGAAPLYFLAYRVYDLQTVDIKADYGGLDSLSKEDHNRILSLDLRVGSPQMDSTHKIRGGFRIADLSGAFAGLSTIPVEDDEQALRQAIWQRTDAAFKEAQKSYAAVKANREVMVEEEDNSDDFSLDKSANYIGKAQAFNVDRSAWEARLRRLS